MLKSHILSMRYFKHYSSDKNYRDCARIYPQAERVVELKAEAGSKDPPSDMGKCRMLIVLLNPGHAPNCTLPAHSWTEAPLTSRPTHRELGNLLKSVGENWGALDYAEIRCLFENIGSSPRKAWKATTPQLLAPESITSDYDHVVFGWGAFSRPGLSLPKKQLVEKYPNAAWASALKAQNTIIAIGKNQPDSSYFPTHPARVMGNSWGQVIAEQLLAPEKNIITSEL